MTTEHKTVLIAESMGWKNDGMGWWFTEESPVLSMSRVCPFYFTDANSALTLCDAMAKEGWVWRAKNDDTHSEVCFQFVNDEFAFDASAPTLPAAICEAFGKARGLWQ